MKRSNGSKKKDKKGDKWAKTKSKQEERMIKKELKRAHKNNNDRIWIKHWNSFQAAVQERGCNIRDIKGDGNCLFRAVSDQLFGNEDRHSDLRSVCVHFMRKKEDTVKLFLEVEDESFEQYVERLEDHGEWGGYFELYCLSLLLEVNFTIVLKDLNVIKMQHFPDTEVRTFFLSYHQDEKVDLPEHYSSIRLAGDDETNAISKQIPLDLFCALNAKGEPLKSNVEVKRDDSEDDYQITSISKKAKKSKKKKANVSPSKCDKSKVLQELEAKQNIKIEGLLEELGLL